MAAELPELLCRVNFPLYHACMISPRHLLLAGGGGAANTGIYNGFEIFEISHNGYHCVADSVIKHETGEFAVMNLASSRFDSTTQRVIIATGLNENCQTYELRLALETGKKDTNDNSGNGTGVRHRGGVANGVAPKAKPSSGDASEFSQAEADKIIFKVVPLKKVRTDCSAQEPYQKVCRISPDGKLLATGGCDGILRVWTFPDLNAVHEIEAHGKEIDDMDFSPDNSKVVTISKDLRALVWDVKKGKKHAEMGWDYPSNIKYAYKRIRFGCVEGSAKNYKLFSISNPIGSSKAPSFLQRWNTKNFTIEQAVRQTCVLSALAVSDNGNFVAVGTMFDGIVEIYTAFNLVRLKRIEHAHSMFITGLEFLSTSDEAEAIRGFTDASVVSISVDHQVCIHHIPKLRKISVLKATFVIVGLLILVFMFCSYLGL